MSDNTKRSARELACEMVKQMLEDDFGSERARDRVIESWHPTVPDGKRRDMHKYLIKFARLGYQRTADAMARYGYDWSPNDLDG